jgi:RNA polymerase sigma factor (sigma-70 family)
MAGSFLNRFSTSNLHLKYPTNEQLFQGLARGENAAIVCLQDKSYGSIVKIIKNFNLPNEKIEDILNKSTVIFLQKISDRTYEYIGNAPSTYLIEIARNLAHAATRKSKFVTESIENHHYIAETETEDYSQHQENTELVRQLLGQLGEPCSTVIRLQHIDGFSDEEVVNQGLTKYSTVDSLKMKRSDCMKKLIQLAQKWKISNNI